MCEAEVGSPDDRGSFVTDKWERTITLLLCILNEFATETISKRINCYILRAHNDSRNKKMSTSDWHGTVALRNSHTIHPASTVKTSDAAPRSSQKRFCSRKPSRFQKLLRRFSHTLI